MLAFCTDKNMMGAEDEETHGPPAKDKRATADRKIRAEIVQGGVSQVGREGQSGRFERF